MSPAQVTYLVQFLTVCFGAASAAIGAWHAYQAHKIGNQRYDELKAALNAAQAALANFQQLPPPPPAPGTITITPSAPVPIPPPPPPVAGTP